MSVKLSLEQSYRLLKSLGSFLHVPLDGKIWITIINQEIASQQNPSSAQGNLEQLPALVKYASENILGNLRQFLPRTGSPREKINAINERLTIITNAWSVLYALSKTSYVNDIRITPLFIEAIYSLKHNYQEGREIYYHYIEEAVQSIPEHHQWLLKELSHIISNFRENNVRLREMRDRLQARLSKALIERDEMNASAEQLALENRSCLGQIKALEFSTEAVIEARAVEKASGIQNELAAQKQRVSDLEAELRKARTRLRIIFIFISTVSALTLFFSRRKRS